VYVVIIERRGHGIGEGNERWEFLVFQADVVEKFPARWSEKDVNPTFEEHHYTNGETLEGARNLQETASL